MRAEHISPSSPTETLSEHALSALIASQWLIHEASARGLGVTSAQATRRLAERREAYPNGAEEFQEFLKLSGQTPADAMLVARTEVAADRIRAALASEEPRVTPIRLLTYYKRHKKDFVLDEQRPVEVGQTESEAAALALKRKLIADRLTGSATGLQQLEYSSEANHRSEELLYRAIYAAKPGVLMGPIKDGRFYFIFRLTAIVPPLQQTLVEVRATVEKRLLEEQHHQSLNAFIAAWRTKWLPETSCLAKYAVRQCRGYSGAVGSAHENPFTVL